MYILPQFFKKDQWFPGVKKKKGKRDEEMEHSIFRAVKYSIWHCNGGYMSLYIGQNPKVNPTVNY